MGQLILIQPRCLIAICLRHRHPSKLVGHAKQFNTLKSKDDERNVQDLLVRLQKLAVNAEKRAEPAAAKEGDFSEINQLRRVPFDKLRKLVTLYQKDPLIWNSSVLGRIYKLPEHYCENICFYVGPMVFYATNDHDEVQRMRQTAFVVDVGRFKTDENYLKKYKRIVFPKLEHD